jgi:hypothetical protein
VDGAMAEVVKHRAWLWRSFAKAAFSIVKDPIVVFVPTFVDCHPFFPVIHLSDFGSAMWITMQMPGTPTCSMALAMCHERIGTSMSHITTACLDCSGKKWHSPVHAASLTWSIGGKTKEVVILEEIILESGQGGEQGLKGLMDIESMRMGAKYGEKCEVFPSVTWSRIEDGGKNP